MAKSSTRAGFSAEEIGFLAGGPGRAAEAALARLMDGGLVRVSREGLVTAVHQNGYGATTRIEANILAGLNGAAHPIGAVVAFAARSQEMASLRQSLVDRGLVRRRGGNSGNVTGMRIVLIFAAIPVTITAFAIDHIFFALAAVLLFFAIILRNKGMLTALGKSALKYADRNARGRVDAVALRGLRGRVGSQWVAAMYGLPPEVVTMVPVMNGKRKKQHYSHSSGGGSHDYVHACGSSSSCSGSSCSSSSCGSSSSCSSSSSSSCSSSSGSSCGSSSG